MKRRNLLLLLLVAAFITGVVGSAIVSTRQSASFAKAEQERFLRTVTELRQKIYGTNYFHLKGVFPDIEAQLAAFDPSQGKGSIVLSYVGGMGGGDHFLRLEGDGSLFQEVQGRRELITKVPAERCKAFFQQVLTSGILNYSEGVIAMKEDLLRLDSISHVTDCPDTGIRISVPELGVEKFVSIYALEVEARNYPEIVDFQIVLRIEKEIRDLVPEDHLLWK